MVKFRSLIFRATLLLCIIQAGAMSAFCADKLPDTMTGVMHPMFKTLQVKVLSKDFNEIPGTNVITLDSGEKIIISFDEIAEDRSYLRYELIHCNALWVPDGLVDTEFLDGFNEVNIEDYAFSSATLVHYVNYRIVIPNEQMRPLISGNYLLRVYNEDDPETTLVQARFSVTEQSAPVGATVTSRTDFDYNNKSQQLSIKVDAERLNINDIYNDIKIVVEQDGRTDNTVVIEHPLSVNGRVANYEHNRDLVFAAGNEYRRFESISDYYPGRGVEQLIFADPLYHVDLYPDTPRTGGRYEYDLSLQGRYVVRRDNCDNSDTDADYVVVHFTLAMPELPQYNIYIEGDLTDRRLNTESRMVYNHETGAYEKALLLKQGAYSYQYIALPKDNSGHGLTDVVEGDYYPTQHTYTIKVYYRQPGGRYDRLAGVLQVASNQ